MPRTYKPKGKHRYKTYSREQITNAINELRDNLTFKQVSNKYKISMGVLNRHYKAAVNGLMVKKQGGQNVLNAEDETIIASRLSICFDWGYPLEMYDIRLIIKSYLEKSGIVVKKFKDNVPGYEFVKNFLQRNSMQISGTVLFKPPRINMKCNRDVISPFLLDKYFKQLEEALIDVPPENIINYDEISLTNDLSKKKVIMRKATKYPERVLSSKRVTSSVMLACNGSGDVLSPYVVYKAANLKESWTVNGPAGSKYNKSITGWFDVDCFEDWFANVVVPFVKNIPGRKVLIGDVMSTFLTVEVIRLCEEYDLEFVFVPKNSTHVTQPIYAGIYQTLKSIWRLVIAEFKQSEEEHSTVLPRTAFPGCLSEFMRIVLDTQCENVKAGFKMCGVVPLDCKKAFARLPDLVEVRIDTEVDDSIAVDDNGFMVVDQVSDSIDAESNVVKNEYHKSAVPHKKKKGYKCYGNWTSSDDSSGDESLY